MDWKLLSVAVLIRLMGLWVDRRMISLTEARNDYQKEGSMGGNIMLQRVDSDTTTSQD